MASFFSSVWLSYLCRLKERGVADVAYMAYATKVILICLYVIGGSKMKFILTFFGTLSLALGVAGIFLPVLPTTPFLLLSAALYFRSSPRLYEWLMNHPHLGEYIRNFREHNAIPLRVKIISVSLVWITLLNCALFVAVEWWSRLLFILLAVAISVHILHYKTLKR